MKKLASTCRIAAASLLVSSGLLAAVAVEPADAIKVRRKSSSTDSGTFDVDYEIDYTGVSNQGVPDAGTITSLDITIKEVFDNFDFFSSDISSFSLIASDTPVSIEFSSDSDSIQLELDQLGLDLAPSFLSIDDSALVEGLLETQYTILFSQEFSDEVPIDPSGVQGITLEQKESGVDGIIDVFFSQPSESEELIYSFGRLTYTSTLPEFISSEIGVGGGEIYSPEPFYPITSVNDIEPVDVPEPSMTISLLVIGAAYGARKRIRRYSQNFV